MAPHGRKYGEKESHPVPIWNGIFEHYERISDALWEFEKCIDWITEERDGVGIVLGGKPVKVSEIVAAIKGSKKETVRRHMDALEKENFIRRRRTPYAYVIEVLNSRKFGIWKHPQEKQQKDVSLPQEKPIHGSEKPTGGSEKPKNNNYKEDAAVDSTVDAAAETAPATDTLNPWELLGSDLPMGSLKFQKIFEHYYAARNGNSLSEAMERTIQRANKTGVGVPPKFYEAKRTVERREADEIATHAADAIPELEALPWARKS